MSELLRIKFDKDGRAFLEMTPEMADLLREALSIAKEEGGVVRADLSKFGAAAAFFARIEDSHCLDRLTFGFEPEKAAKPTSTTGGKGKAAPAAKRGMAKPKKGKGK